VALQTLPQPKRRFSIWPYLFLAPALISMAALTFCPAVYTIFIAFTNYSLKHFTSYTFVGLKNFYNLLTPGGAFSDIFLPVLVWTLCFALITVTINYGDGTPASTNQGMAPDPNLHVTQVGGAGGTTYTVTDAHTFPEESGSTVPPFAFTVTLTVKETATPANTDTGTTPAQVLDAALSPGNPVTPQTGQQFFGGNSTNMTTAAQAEANFEAAIGGVKNHELYFEHLGGDG